MSHFMVADVEALSTAEYPLSRNPVHVLRFPRSRTCPRPLQPPRPLQELNKHNDLCKGPRPLQELNKHDDLCRPPSGGGGAGAALQDSGGAGVALQAAAPEQLSAAAPGRLRGRGVGREGMGVSDEEGKAIALSGDE